MQSKNVSIGFLQLDSKTSRQLLPQIEENGRNLLRISQYCAKEQDYGLARSLAILGAEEHIKATIIFLHSEGIQVYRVNQLNKAATNHHTNRHETVMLLNTLFGIQDFTENLKALLEPRQVKSNPFTALKDVFESFRSMSSSDVYSWWKNAETYKQRGFYTDYSDGLLSPGSIVKEDYDKTLEIIDLLQDTLKRVKLNFEIAKEKKASLVKDLNKGLDIQVKSQKNSKSKK